MDVLVIFDVGIDFLPDIRKHKPTIERLFFFYWMVRIKEIKVLTRFHALLSMHPVFIVIYYDNTQFYNLSKNKL